MPNRVLRDWTASETIDSLSEHAEILFVRLIMKADDHGCFYGNPKLIKAALFPLRPYSEKQITQWRDELLAAGVVQMYSVDGKVYMKINNFNQRLRLMQSKFPQPELGQIIEPSNDGQLSVICPPETKRSRNEEETETKGNSTFDLFWEKYDKKVGKEITKKLWDKITPIEHLTIMAHLDEYTKTEKKFRKDPERYLKYRCWQDELMTSKENTQSKFVE